jgi:hypothetical protein
VYQPELKQTVPWVEREVQQVVVALVEVEEVPVLLAALHQFNTLEVLPVTHRVVRTLLVIGTQQRQDIPLVTVWVTVPTHQA